MGSILNGDLDDRLVDESDPSTIEAWRKLAAGRLSLLLLVMAADSLGHTAEMRDDQREESDDEPPMTSAHYKQAG